MSEQLTEAFEDHQSHFVWYDNTADIVQKVVITKDKITFEPAAIEQIHDASNGEMWCLDCNMKLTGWNE